ncbi:MAG: DUF4382 domain-containing protein [Haloplanus sp.]
MDESDPDAWSASRRTYLRATGGLAAAGVAGLAGCMGGGEATTGTLATRVSDQPGDITDFESCVVTIAGFWVKPGTSDSESTATATTTDAESGAREYYEFAESQTADLVELQGDRSALLGEQELETGTYAYLQLDVTSVDATLADGGEATVDTPGNAPLQFKHPFEIRADTRTVFTADFTPVRQGRSGSYLLKPVARETDVSYESTGETGTGTQTEG